MNELVKKYKYALLLLNQRIAELNRSKAAAIQLCKDFKIDPEKDNAVCSLKNRITPLIKMRNDLREVTKEITHYYDRSWWRSEKYTQNERKSRKYVYSRPVQ
ncbi:MAG: hypothetical protein ABFD25_21000 [Clostridiaceae bacterium]